MRSSSCQCAELGRGVESFDAPGQRLLTAHADLREELDGRDIEALVGRIKQMLAEKWGVNHATLEPEVLGYGNGDTVGTWDHTRY